MENPSEKTDVTVISPEDAVCEFMMLGLRKTEGVSKTEFKKRFGVTLAERFGEVIGTYIEKGLLAENDDCVFFTEQGVYVSNTVLCEFV